MDIVKVGLPATVRVGKTSVTLDGIQDFEISPVLTEPGDRRSLAAAQFFGEADEFAPQNHEQRHPELVTASRVLIAGKLDQ
jgi:hypothetical protein